ncbi:MAG: hypothetical protein AAFX03_03050 [Pseudomonadota bacterium]
MSDTPYRFSKTLVYWFVFGGSAACAATIGLIAVATAAMGATMSIHGWAALIIGAVLSFAVGLSLSALLVWGRRNGYDEGAHEAAFSTREEP